MFIFKDSFIKNNRNMRQDFKNAIIYKNTNDSDDDIYVGSTCNTHFFP